MLGAATSVAGANALSEFTASGAGSISGAGLALRCRRGLSSSEPVDARPFAPLAAPCLATVASTCRLARPGCGGEPSAAARRFGSNWCAWHSASAWPRRAPRRYAWHRASGGLGRASGPRAWLRASGGLCRALEALNLALELPIHRGGGLEALHLPFELLDPRGNGLLALNTLLERSRPRASRHGPDLTSRELELQP